MQHLFQLAENANRGLNTNDNELFVNSSFQLYNYVAQNGARMLTTINDTIDLQKVGYAFSYNARFINNNDNDINSVAAENSYYCLAKSILKGNFLCAPELFNLIHENPNLLMDKFLFAVSRNNGNSLNLLEQIKTRKEIINLLPCLKFYIVDLFYDIRRNKTKIPHDLKRYNEVELNRFTVEALKISEFETLISRGQSFFNDVYSEIEDTLFKF